MGSIWILCIFAPLFPLIEVTVSINKKCSLCNAPVSSDAPEGMCPTCALRDALEAGPDFPAEIASQGFARAGAVRGEILHYFGDYELQNEIARGGMGRVFRARQVSLNRTVALKMILAGRLATEAEVKRFQAEAAAVAQLQHPNIVAIHEVGVHEGQHYFSMDFVAGTDMATLVRDHPLSAPVATRYLKTVAEAVHYAHQQGVLHRDLKPANILIDENDQPRITDFGLAKQIESDSDLTRSGQVLGSPSFMSPEQAGGQRNEVGPRSDVYSLGAILYHLLTGRPPFVGATPQTIIAQVLSSDPVAPRTLSCATPGDLETICLKCLEKDPGRRYPTAQELALDLGRFLNGEPVHARPVSRREKAWRWCQRNRALASALTAAVVLLLALTLGSTVGALRIAKARNAERTERVRAQNREQESLERMARLKVAEGWRLVEQGGWFEALAPFTEALMLESNSPPREAAHRARIAYLLQCGPQLDRMWFPGGPITCIEVSPDGRRVLTATASFAGRADEAIAQVWDLATGQPTTAPMRHAGRINSARFSPDGNRVATASEDRTARVWNAATGEPLSPPLLHATGVPHAAFSRDGTRLGTCSPPNWHSETNGQATVWDGITGEKLYTNLIGGMDAQVVMFANDDRWLAVGSRSYLCNFFDVNTRERVAAVPDCWSAFALTCSPDASKILVAGTFGLFVEPGARLFDARTMEPCSPFLAQPDGFVRVAVFSPGGQFVATAGDDGSARLWNADTGESWAAPLVHSGPVVSAVFSSDGRRLLTASRDGTARVWEAETGLPAHAPLRHGGPVCGAWFTKDGDGVVTGSEDGAVRVWALSPSVPAARILLAKNPVRHARFSSDGRRILTADSGGVVQLWDGSTLQPVMPPLHHSDSIVVAEFCQGGRRLLTYSEDYLVRVWDLSVVTSKPLWQGSGQIPDITRDGSRVAVPTRNQIGVILDGETGKPLTPALLDLLPAGSVEVSRKARFSPDGLWVGFADENGIVGLWEVAPIRPGPRVAAHASSVTDLCFSPDARRLLTVSKDNTARLWDTKSGAPLSKPLSHAAPVRVAAFSPDGRLALTGSDDGTARLWACPDGRPACTALSHRGAILDACFSKDGRRVATASSDGSARVWDSDTGESLTPPLPHAGQVRTVEFSPDGRCLLTASDDQTARLWTLPSDARSIVQLLSEALLLCPGFFGTNAPEGDRWRFSRPMTVGESRGLHPELVGPANSDGPADLALLLATWKRVERPSDYDRKLRVLSRLTDAATNQWTWLFERGYARHRLRDYRGAVDDFSRAIQAVPEASVCWPGPLPGAFGPGRSRRR